MCLWCEDYAAFLTWILSLLWLRYELLCFHSPFFVDWAPSQSFIKPCLDVSCSFLQPHWGMWGCPSSGLQARYSHLAANTHALVQNPGLCRTRTHLSLCPLLSSIASVHTGTLLAPLTYQPSLQAASKALGCPNSSCTSPMQILLEI